jgi:F-type H+-transporting ATPase subunit b
MRLRLVLLLVTLLLAASFLPALATAAEASDDHAQDSASTELVFKWLNFALVFGGGAYFLGGPLKRKLAAIRQGIRREIADARRQRETSQERLAEIEARLAGLEEEIQAMRKEAAQNAAAEQQRIQEATRREAERLLATTGAEIDSAGRAARLELRAYAARLVVNLAERSIEEQLTPQAHAALFEASLRGFPARSGADRERRA